MADSDQLTEAAADATKAARTTTAPGTTGVIATGGYVQTGESQRELVGRQKWLTYANAMNVAIVATGVRYFGNLLAGTEWHAEPNERGGKDAQRGVDIATQGLLRAPLPQAWPFVVRKAAMYRFLGYSLHATGIARRDDGMIVYSDIAHRPQHTIEQWLRDDETLPFASVVQRSPETNKTYDIKLDECLYCVDNLLSDQPEGVGLLRHVIELVRRLGLFEGLEGSGYFQDIAGLAIARAPLEEIVAGITDVNLAKQKIDDATRAIVNAVANRVRTPEKQQYLKLDSATYRGSDANQITDVKKWGIEVIRGEQENLAQLDKTIQRVGLEIARMLGIEFALVGGGDSAGSYGMHEDKTSMFATNLQTTLTEISHFAGQQLVRRLIALNGLDPDTCTPTLVAEPISTEAIETVTRALANLSLANLALNDPARPVLRKRMRLPAELPPEESLLLPKPSRRQPGEKPAPTNGKPKGNEPAKPEDMTAVDNPPTKGAAA